ncbi:MAG: hypothetical protein AAFP84_00625 [Actinomycetota bacterium]
MLSWSGDHAGDTVDLTSVESGRHLAGEHSTVLWRFASACAGSDDDELAAARAAVVDATDTAFMVDASAVAANFEMMTRLADSTGARMPAEVLEARAGAIGALGVAELTSRR